MTQAIAIQDEEYHERFSPRVWRRLLGFARPYWRLYVGMIVTSLALAGTEAAFPLVTKAVIDDIQAHGRGANLLAYAAMYVGLTASLAMEILCFSFRSRSTTAARPVGWWRGSPAIATGFRGRWRGVFWTWRGGRAWWRASSWSPSPGRCWRTRRSS